MILESALIWQLVFPGYIGVEGKTFDSKEECRKWAINKAKGSKPTEMPEWWECVSKVKPALPPFEEREITGTHRYWCGPSHEQICTQDH